LPFGFFRGVIGFGAARAYGKRGGGATGKTKNFHGFTIRARLPRRKRKMGDTWLDNRAVCAKIFQIPNALLKGGQPRLSGANPTDTPHKFMNIGKSILCAICASALSAVQAAAQEAAPTSLPDAENSAARAPEAASEKGAAPDIPNYSADDYRNFFGLCWISNPDEILRYARQMGYKHVYYQGGMEKHPLSKGMYFVMESPEYSVYRRVIDISKKYPPEVIREWETTCSLISLDKPFPQNMATGWFVPPHHFTATLDLQQEKVIEDITNKIIDKVKKIQMANPEFKFSGFAWDVPQPFGDFWSEHTTKKMHNGRQVTLAHWTGKDASVKHPDVTHEYATYSEGHFEFYRRLFQKARSQINPEAKWIVEPYSVYNDWMRYMDWDFMKAKGDKRSEYMPDLVCSEGNGTEFVDNPKNFESGLIDRTRVASTTPNVFDDETLRKIAGAAASKGAWTGWFGRPGGTGNNPGYRSIRDIPARIKLNRAVAVWENLNGTPLSQRKWDGVNYSSPTAEMTPDVIWAIQPETKKLFFVFLSDKGEVKIPDGYKVKEIYHADGLWQEIKTFPAKKSIVSVKKGKIVPRSPYVVNAGFIAQLAKKGGALNKDK